MSWFWIALAAPFLWAISNHIDKFSISNFFSGKGAGASVIFTGLTGGFIALVVAIFKYSSITLGPAAATIIALNGAWLVASFIPYVYAIQTEEATIVGPIFQLIPAFNYFLGLIFLNEHLSAEQIIASLFVIAGALLLSFDFHERFRLKKRPLLLMVLSSFMLSISTLVFKIIALDTNFWGSVFWEYVGAGVFAVLLFLIPLYRHAFISALQRGGRVVVGLNILTETANIVAKMLMNFATLLAPLALVWLVNGFQPAFILLIGIILTLFRPQWGTERIDVKSLAQKGVALGLMGVGVWMLFK